MVQPCRFRCSSFVYWMEMGVLLEFFYYSAKFFALRKLSRRELKQAWVRPSGSAHYQQTQVQKGSKTQRFIKCSVVRMRCNHAIRALEWPRYKDFAFSKNHYSRRLHQNPNRVFSRGWCCCATLPRKTRYSQVRHDGSKRLYIETLNLLRIEYLFNDFISALMVSRLSLSTNPSVCYHKFGFLDSFCELISRFVVDMDYLVNQAMSHTDEGFNKFVSYFSFFRQATMFIKTDITLLGQYSTRITTLLKLLLKVTSQEFR